MANIISFPSGPQTMYISCVSVTPPAKISYSSSDRVVDAVKFPHQVAIGICDMLNTRWCLDASLEPVEPPHG